LPPDHRHEFKILIPITILDMTTITVIDHGMSLSVLYKWHTARFSKKSLGSDVGEIKKKSVLTPRNVREKSNTLFSVIYYKTPSKHLVLQDLKLPDAKTLNASVFFILRLKIDMWMTKNACAYFSKCTKIVPFYLCPVPKCVFSVFNFRIEFKT
jgi:hypothetical protein